MTELRLELSNADDALVEITPIEVKRAIRGKRDRAEQQRDSPGRGPSNARQAVDRESRPLPEPPASA